MFLSKKKSCKRNNDSNRRGDYWKFDEVSSEMRESVMKSYAEKVVAHDAANGKSCRWGVVKELVDTAAQVAPLLKITRDNINNKVRNIWGPYKQRGFSPVIPYHAIGCPTLSSILDLSMSTSSISERTSAENPLDILANQAAVMFELSLPNVCSYEGCDAPLDLVPEHCSSCLRFVCQVCQQFLVGPGVNTSTLLCQDCCDDPSITTGQDSSAASSDDSTALPIYQSTIFPSKEKSSNNARSQR